MPIIKPAQQRISPEGQVGGQATGTDFGGPGLHQVGQAVQQATSDTAQMMAILAHNKARNEASDADLKLTLLGMDLQTDLDKRVQDHRKGDPDFTEDALTEFNSRVEKLRYNDDGEENYETNYGKRIFDTKHAHLAKQYVGLLGNAQRQLQGSDAVETFNGLTAAHSNAVAQGQGYLTVGPRLQEYENSIRTGVFQTMPADKREDLLRQGKGAIANSAMDGFIRADPRGAQTALQAGFLADSLTKDQTSALLDKAQTGVNMAEAADRRKQEALVHATELASQSQAAIVSNAYLTERASPTYDPFQTQSKMFDLMRRKEMDNLTGPQIMAMVGALDSDIKEAKSGSTQGNVDLDRRLFAKIAAGKMPDITEINRARAQPNHPISAAQHEELVKEWNTSRTPEGRSLQVGMEERLKAAEPMIMPKDLTGVLADPESGLRMAQLTHDVRTQIDKARREGKDPHVLLNPDNPDYLFTNERLKKYVTPFLERIRKASERLAEKPGAPKTPEGGTQPSYQRLPGESIKDWQKRTGQK